MKKIIMSANTSWFIYNFYKDLIKELIEQGFKIYALAPFDKETQKLAEIGCITADIKIDNKGSNFIKDFRTFKAYLEYYRKVKPSYCLHFTVKPNIYGTLAAKIIGAESINTITGLGTAFIHETWVSKFVKIMYKLSQSFAKRIFLFNSDDLELFIRLRLAPPEKLKLIPGSGINLDFFYPSPLKAEVSLFTFLFVGRILRDKGIVELVEATRILRNRGVIFRMVVIGFLGVDNRTAITLSQINQWVQEGVIEYAGTPSDVRTAIRNSDCIVLPSYREGLPLSLLEASAMEKPIITTDVAGCRDVIVHEETGLLCRSKDPMSLANSMEFILNMPPQKLHEMGVRGRVFVASKFDARMVYAHYISEVNP